MAASGRAMLGDVKGAGAIQRVAGPVVTAIGLRPRSAMRRFASRLPMLAPRPR